MATFNRQQLAATFLRFVVVGVIATAVQYAVLIAAVQLWGWQPELGSGVGFALGAVVSYLLNRSFTFRSDMPHATATLRFVIVISVGLVLNVLLMRLLRVQFALPYVLAQVLTTGIVLFWHFAGNALWSFARRRPAGEGA